MIFSESFFNPSHYIVAGSVICVYQGEQPSIDDFIANYNTSYNFASSNILKLIVKSGDGDINNIIVTDPDGQYYTQGIKSFRSGTAMWASIHHPDSGEGPMELPPNSEGYIFLSDSEVINYQQAISRALFVSTNRIILTIVPVSDLTDNGVIKFRSTSFTHPNISDEDRAIDMSVIGSRS